MEQNKVEQAEKMDNVSSLLVPDEIRERLQRIFADSQKSNSFTDSLLARLNAISNNDFSNATPVEKAKVVEEVQQILYDLQLMEWTRRTDIIDMAKCVFSMNEKRCVKRKKHVISKHSKKVNGAGTKTQSGVSNLEHSKNSNKNSFHKHPSHFSAHRSSDDNNSPNNNGFASPNSSQDSKAEARASTSSSKKLIVPHFSSDPTAKSSSKQPPERSPQHKPTNFQSDTERNEKMHSPPSISREAATVDDSLRKISDGENDAVKKSSEKEGSLLEGEKEKHPKIEDQTSAGEIAGNSSSSLEAGVDYLSDEINARQHSLLRNAVSTPAVGTGKKRAAAIAASSSLAVAAAAEYAASQAGRSQSPRKKAASLCVVVEAEQTAMEDDEPVYCKCKQISFGDMICCDGPSCPIEWFHFSCVGIKTKPKGKWYCPDCSVNRKTKK